VHSISSNSNSKKHHQTNKIHQLHSKTTGDTRIIDWNRITHSSDYQFDIPSDRKKSTEPDWIGVDKQLYKRHLKIGSLASPAYFSSSQYCIDEQQIEDKSLLLTWLQKFHSKQTYCHGKKHNTMTTLSTHNRFSVLAHHDVDLADDDDDCKPAALATPPTRPSTDVIMTIADKNPHMRKSSSSSSSIDPQLTVPPSHRASVPPPLPTVTNTWQIVNLKQEAKDSHLNQEEYSNRYAPMYLPPAPIHDNWENEALTTKVLPITV
jgi:hypothetical protein